MVVYEVNYSHTSLNYSEAPISTFLALFIHCFKLSAPSTSRSTRGGGKEEGREGGEERGCGHVSRRCESLVLSRVVT